MTQRSAGILMYKRAQQRTREWAQARAPDDVRLLLVHPGGPFWAKKDLGAWSIPKGEYEADEDPLTAAIREFEEETGAVPRGEFHLLGALRQPSRKLVTAYALEGDFDVAALASNRFEIEWPPRSGRIQSFPEVDRAEWFAPERAREKILEGQRPFIDRLLALLADASADNDGGARSI